MKLAIMGGGMSGLVCAIASARQGFEVQIFERNPRVGKKISMTGNGKCNILNSNVTAKNFNNSSILANVLQSVSVSNCIDFLTSVGIFTYSDAHGRIYPITDNANSVIDCLRFECQKLGVKTAVECNVSSINSTNDKKFVVCTENGDKFTFDKVVLACGSDSQSQKVQLEEILPKNYLTPLCPSLVPVKIKGMDKLLNGIRIKTTAKLLDKNLDTIDQREGEVQFKDYGLTGICIMDLSAHIARNIVKNIHQPYFFQVDLVPSLPQTQLEHILSQRLSQNTPTDSLFLGILHNKIAQTVLNRCQIDVATQNDVQKLSHTTKNLRFEFDKLLDFSMSQVTAGGICQNVVDDKLQLKNGMYAIGEVLDVDGNCGGFNLYFAMASALHFAKELA